MFAHVGKNANKSLEQLIYRRGCAAREFDEKR
jgi:hypothetical protein